MSGDTSIESQPLYQLGLWVNGLIDAAIGKAVELFDRAMQDATHTLTLLAVVGLGCAVLAWLLGAVFSRANRPPAPARSARAPGRGHPDRADAAGEPGRAAAAQRRAAAQAAQAAVVVEPHPALAGGRLTRAPASPAGYRPTRPLAPGSIRRRRMPSAKRVSESSSGSYPIKRRALAMLQKARVLSLTP